VPWFFAVAERDHAIQNPTSAEKIRRLGEHLRLRRQLYPRHRLRPRRPGRDPGADIRLSHPPVVHPRGHVVVGEPFWRRWPLPDGVDDAGYVTLHETAARFDAAGLRVVGLIAASEDDWDTYESLHWRALEEWLGEHGDDPDADEIRHLHEVSRDRYVTSQRELLGWAIVIGRKRPARESKPARPTSRLHRRIDFYGRLRTARARAPPGRSARRVSRGRARLQDRGEGGGHVRPGPASRLRGANR